MVDTHYDVIVIGSGPGGASVAHRLAPTGKRILMLERGAYLPRSRANWDAKTVFVDGAYQAPDTWYGKDGESFRPGLHYWVGGNSKVYGAALFRLRERDFGAVQHTDGVSPAWPLGYDVFEPYYGQAEALFHVHGQRGEDPNEPWSSTPYAYAPVSHEPRIQALSDSLTKEGLHPFHLPLGILLDEKDGKVTPTSPCIRCDAFDGFPCAINAKADAQVICVDPTLKRHDTVTLLTGAYVTRLETDASGDGVSKVHVTRGGAEEAYSADIVVVACGALSSALLLLRSASDKHPTGLANGSDQVGRNYMRHTMSILMAVLKEPNHTVFQKTLALSDFYFGSEGYDYPLGLIQMCAASHGEQIRGETVPGFLQWLPELPFDTLSDHSMNFWLQSEDLPRPENRIAYDGDRVVLSITEGNGLAAKGLKHKLESLLGVIGAHPVLLERSLYLGKDIPINGTAHQAGTCRFGPDPRTSVLDLDCKAHQLDNLYVTDASFFPSIGAVNPTLTIIANALRVADHIKTRLRRMIRNAVLRTLTRASLVVLFPFSAADKIVHWGQAMKQARSGPALVAPVAPELLLAGIAVETIAPVCIVTGRRDREAAGLLAGFCAATALLYHPFWTHDDLFAPGESTGRAELWEFLKNFGLVGGLMIVALDDKGRGPAPPRRSAAVATARQR